MGLNEAFEPTRRHILVLKSIPSIEDVFIWLLLMRGRNILSQVQLRILFTKGLVKMINLLPRFKRIILHLLRLITMEAIVQNNALCTYCGQLGHIVGKAPWLSTYRPGHK